MKSPLVATHREVLDSMLFNRLSVFLLAVPPEVSVGDGVVLRNKLILVMGMQRSGTTALLHALGQDPSLQVENEAPDGPIYHNFLLRPEPEIRSVLWKFRRRVILKPVVEIERRSLDDVLQEFRQYDPLVAWIYRDPVNVWSSAKNTFQLSGQMRDEWIEKWIRGNESLLASLRGPFRNQIVVVRYRDLIEERAVFDRLCAFLKVEPRNNLFWREDLKKGRKSLPPDVQLLIEQRTSEVLEELHRHRLRPEEKTPAGELGFVNVASLGPWSLSGQSCKMAKLVQPDDNPGRASVEIWPNDDSIHGKVSLCYPGLELKKGVRHAVFLWARSDSDNFLQLTPNSAVDGDLMPAETIALSSKWQPVRIELAPAADHTNACLAATIFGHPGRVELTDPLIGSSRLCWNSLELHDEAQAHLVPVPDDRGAVRVVVDRLPNAVPPAVQFVAGRAKILGGCIFTVTFRIRAETTRPVSVALGQAHEPWQVQGFYERLEIGTSWQTFAYDFQLPEDDLVRLYFDLGEHAAAVEISDTFLIPARSRICHSTAHRGAICRIEFPRLQPGVVRASAAPGTSQALNDVQLFEPDRTIVRGQRYRVSFRARADAPRDISFGVGENYEPWADLGIYHEVSVGRQWQDYYFEFVGLEDTTRGRILFDVGRDEAAVEICDALLEPVDAELTSHELGRLEMIAQSMSAR